MNAAFGLDLAGYSSAGKSKLVFFQKQSDMVATATVIEVPVFKRRHEGKNLLVTVTDEEVRLFKACLTMGFPLLVDVPIDLQGLPSPERTHWVWQLTQRSVDRAFNGMAPLASLLGYATARFRNLLRVVESELSQADLLGKTIWETYPAAGLKQILRRKPKPYKARTTRFIGSEWVACEQPNQEAIDNTGLCQLATDLHLSSSDEQAWSDDDIDAVICALTGVLTGSDCLEGEDLRLKIEEKLTLKGFKNMPAELCKPPVGYVLPLRNPFRQIRLDRKNISEMSNFLEDVRQ